MGNKSKRAIITGANGFIGQHLWDALIERDIEPIALDRHDLYTDVPALTEIIFHHKPHYIFHLAAYANHRGQHDDAQIVMANYWATYNLLKATQFLDYEAFINIGSSSMYGIKKEPMKETDSLEPDTFYAATKAGACYLARVYAKQYNKPVANIIPFSVYGEGEAPFRLIPSVIKHLVSGQEMLLNSNQPHDWIYVSDFINGMMTVADNIQAFKGQMVNVGTGFETTNKGIADELVRISKRKLYDRHIKQTNPFDSPEWVADNSLLQSFGWKPKVSLKDGLTRCWKYYSQDGN